MRSTLTQCLRQAEEEERNPLRRQQQDRPTNPRKKMDSSQKESQSEAESHSEAEILIIKIKKDRNIYSNTISSKFFYSTYININNYTFRLSKTKLCCIPIVIYLGRVISDRIIKYGPYLPNTSKYGLENS